MWFWRDGYFKTLKDVAAEASKSPEWADYAAYCTEHERGLRPKIHDFFGEVGPTGSPNDPGWDYRLWLEEWAEPYLGTEPFASLERRFASTPGVTEVAHMDREVFLTGGRAVARVVVAALCGGSTGRRDVMPNHAPSFVRQDVDPCRQNNISATRLLRTFQASRGPNV